MHVSDDPAHLKKLLTELSTLTTESTAAGRGDLETLTTLELVRAMNAEDAKVADAVAAQASVIADAVDGIVERLRRGGRPDLRRRGDRRGGSAFSMPSECPPTFGTDPGTVVGLIAGGTTAIQTAVENAEDDVAAAPRGYPNSPSPHTTSWSASPPPDGRPTSSFCVEVRPPGRSSDGRDQLEPRFRGGVPSRPAGRGRRGAGVRRGLDPAQVRHCAEARGQHAQHAEHGAPRKDLPGHHGRPGRRRTKQSRTGRSEPR